MTSIEHAPRRLRRDPQPLVGGVAAGAGAYLGIPPKIVRIAFAFATFFGGFGLWLYIAAWLLIPRDNPADDRPVALTSSTPSLVAGFIALAFAALTFINGPNDDSAAYVVPIVILGAGFALLNRRPSQSDAGDHAFASTRVQGSWPPMSPDVPPDPATPMPPVHPSSTVGQDADIAPPSAPITPGGGAPVVPDNSAPLAADRSSAETGAIGVPEMVAPPLEIGSPDVGEYDSSPTGPPPWDTPDRAAPWAVVGQEATSIGRSSTPPRHGPPVTSITLATSAVVIGLFLVLVNIAGLGISATSLFGALLVVFGGGLIASAFAERALPLYPLTILTLLMLAVAPLIDTTLGGGVGTREIRVVTEDGLEPSYELGAGELNLDLTQFEPTTDTDLEIDVGAGTIEIEVPAGMRVEVTATSRAGYVEVDRIADEGLVNRVFHIIEGDDPDGPVLRIDASVTFGYVEVVQRGL
ncbi:MAG: PspC domain-containing protein [Acidimicrobiales bacterium]